MYSLLIVLIGFIGWKLGRNFGVLGLFDEEKLPIGLPENDEHYRVVSDGLYVAMDRYGTDEERVFELLEGWSDREMKAIVLAFGYRLYNLGGFRYRRVGLIGWLKLELEGEDYKRAGVIISGAGLAW